MAKTDFTSGPLRDLSSRELGRLEATYKNYPIIYNNPNGEKQVIETIHE